MNEFVYNNKAPYAPCLFHVSPHVRLNMHEQCTTMHNYIREIVLYNGISRMAFILKFKKSFIYQS